MNIEEIRNNTITIIPYLDDIKAEQWIGELFSLKHNAEDIDHDVERECNINKNRDNIQKLYIEKGLKSKHVLLLDSDVLVSEENLNQLITAYDGINPLCIDTKGRMNSIKHWNKNITEEELIEKMSEHHVICACCLMPTEDWLKINYIENPNQCQCLKIKGAKYAPISCTEYHETLNDTQEFNTDEDDLLKGYPEGIEVHKTMPDGTVNVFIT